MRLDEVLQRLERLPNPLPAAPSALLPIILEGPARTTVRLGDVDGSLSRPAAVLVLFVPGGHDELGGNETPGIRRGRSFAATEPDDAATADACIVLTERGTGGRHHSGEVSFPGGRAEPEDADATATALREAVEEIGLDVAAAGVRILGQLDPVWIPVSGYRLTPILAVAARRPILAAAPAEVSRIVDAPVAAFLPDAPIQIVHAQIGERRLRYGAYPIEDLLVWGATARVLGQLGAVLALEPGD